MTGKIFLWQQSIIFISINIFWLDFRIFCIDFGLLHFVSLKYFAYLSSHGLYIRLLCWCLKLISLWCKSHLKITHFPFAVLLQFIQNALYGIQWCAKNVFQLIYTQNIPETWNFSTVLDYKIYCSDIHGCNAIDF